MSIIPQQLVPAASQLGVESFSQIKPQRIVLKPQNDTTYKPNGVNKVTFKIPAYANSFMDTSKSFLSFNVGYDTDTAVSLANQCRLVNAAPVFQRLVLKSNTGLVIDQIDNYHVLSQLISATEIDSSYSPQEGRDFESVFSEGSMKKENCLAQNFKTVGIPIRHYINMGLLSKHTKKWLPLGLMDGGGYAFELELHLSDNNVVLRQTGAVTAPVFRLKNVAYNLEIRTLDDALCKKFNEIACGDKELRLSFKTMHAHTALLNSKKNIVKIHESATSLDRIWNVFLNSADMSTITTPKYDLVGAIGSTGNREVARYNARIGSNWLYNGFIEEDSPATGNMITCSHVKNALDSQSKTLVMEYIEPVTQKPSTRHYVNVLDFQYANEGFKNGISTSTPVEMYFDMSSSYTTNDVMCYSFAEISYDLVLKGGMVSYEEIRPGSNSVYA